MSKQRTKKPTTGRRIVESWISTGQAGKRPIGAVWYEPVHSDLARRIDRAIAAAVRKERERIADIVFGSSALSMAESRNIVNSIRSTP